MFRKDKNIDGWTHTHTPTHGCKWLSRKSRQPFWFSHQPHWDRWASILFLFPFISDRSLYCPTAVRHLTHMLYGPIDWQYGTTSFLLWSIWPGHHVLVLIHVSEPWWSSGFPLHSQKGIVLPVMGWDNDRFEEIRLGGVFVCVCVCVFWMILLMIHVKLFKYPNLTKWAHLLFWTMS